MLTFEIFNDPLNLITHDKNQFKKKRIYFPSFLFFPIIYFFKQKKLKLCIETLIRCTHMVNILGLFSSNEHVDEISTETVRLHTIS